MEKISTEKYIEQNAVRFKRDIEQIHDIVDVSVALGRTAMHLAYEDRVPRYDNGERENDSEHSYMLALIAPELADSFELDLDKGLITQFAIVHELPELVTGDTPTFRLSAEQEQQKAIDDALATGQIAATLPPHQRDLLLRYEKQAEPEARFVRFVDKLLPIIVDIIGEGERVMHEDYNTTCHGELQKSHEKLRQRFDRIFGDEFPDIALAHAVLQEMFESTFMAGPHRGAL